MDANEMQHWLDRNRPPRVQITYDVETLGSAVKQSIPFIVGVIGDFAGGDRTASSPIAERAFVALDRDNFPQVMKTLAPALTLAPQPRFQVFRTPDGSTYETDAAADPFAVSLSFAEMKDFAPPAIIGQIPLLQAQMQTRNGLRDLLAKLGTAPAMDKQLKDAAVAPALVRARTALNAANDHLTGAITAFDTAATAILAAETDDARKKPVTDAQAAVDAAGGTGGAFGKAFAAAVPTCNPDLVSDAGNAAWAVAGMLRDEMQVLVRTSDGYAADANATQPMKDAIPLVAAARAAVDEFMGLAGTAAVQGASALALNPTPTPAPAQPAS
jgi:type VI secretion system protein ImpB